VRKSGIARVRKSGREGEQLNRQLGGRRIFWKEGEARGREGRTESLYISKTYFKSKRKKNCPGVGESEDTRHPEKKRRRQRGGDPLLCNDTIG